MKFGMNLLLWTGDLNDGMLPVLEQLKKIGYDGVEVPIFGADVQKYQQWGKRLTISACGARPSRFARRPITRSRPTRSRARAGVEATKRTLDCCQALGAETLCGPYHSAIGLFSGAGPTADEWKWGVDSMRKVAEHAQAGRRDAGRRIPQSVRDVLPQLRGRHGAVRQAK